MASEPRLTVRRKSVRHALFYPRFDSYIVEGDFGDHRRRTNLMTRAKEASLPFFLNPDVENLEKTLGMPPGFLSRLVEEDDWSFVIKSHALIESALSYLLRSLTDHRAADIYDSLPLHGAKQVRSALSNDFAR